MSYYHFDETETRTFCFNESHTVDNLIVFLENSKKDLLEWGVDPKDIHLDIDDEYGVLIYASKRKPQEEIDRLMEESKKRRLADAPAREAKEKEDAIRRKYIIERENLQKKTRAERLVSEKKDQN